MFRRFILLLVLLTSARASADDTAHWAWTPPVRPHVPAVDARSPIDAFVRAKLNGLSPAPPASRPHLLRRVTFDLTGLPPTPEEVAAFVNDSSPDAYEEVVDRLLASPHYGERWGRHWLDLARYADTNGFEHDEVRPNAWRYRDYVIRAFNADTPFDRFVVEQLAGDLAFPNDPDARTATGFNLLGPDMTDSADQAKRRQDTLNDMTDTAGLVFLGLTVGCARCHDHKFEPITAADYYRMQAFFAGAEFRTDVEVASVADRQRYDDARREYDRLTAADRAALAELERPVREKLFEGKLAKLPAEARDAHRTPADKRDGGQIELVEQTAKKVAVTDAEVEKALPAADRPEWQRLRQAVKQHDARKPKPLPTAMGMKDRPTAPVTHLLERGELSNPGPAVVPGFPSVLLPGRKPTPANITDGRRLALARWIASADNPLTARVIVNRIWQHHFGRGIVPTASDFGVRGERPSHPELLDWLARELIDGGWRLKRMHRLMLLSDTYRQSSVASAEAVRLDPANETFSRMYRRRLEGEAVRDALLAVSGRLNPKAGGPGVFPPVPAGAVTGAKGGWPVSPDPADHVRRSVYVFARRNLRHPFLEAFDQPDSNLSCPKRERSTTAPQALALLNADEVQTAAKALAERLTKEPEAARVDRAYRLTLGRSPTPAERDRATAFLKDSPLAELCRALFNLNEFVYLD